MKLVLSCKTRRGEDIRQYQYWGIDQSEAIGFVTNTQVRRDAMNIELIYMCQTHKLFVALHTWHRLWRGEGRLGTVSRWEPSAHWLGLVTLSVIINVECWKSNFTIGSSSFDILQNKTKGSKVTPRHQWLYSLDQFIRREGCLEIFTIHINKKLKISQSTMSRQTRSR